MKKMFIVKASLFALMAVPALTSCSKSEVAGIEAATPNGNVSSAEVKNGLSGGNGIDQARGSIIGQVNPVPTKAKLTLFDAQGNRLASLYADRLSGNFRFGALAIGTYKLVIEFPSASVDPAFDPQAAYSTVTKEVAVDSNAQVDLGVINL